MSWRFRAPSTAALVAICLAMTFASCGGSSPAPTAQPSPAPTSTARPAVVTSVPRPVATRPPTSVPIPTGATPGPTPGGSPTAVPSGSPTTTAESRQALYVDFSNGPGPFPTNTSDNSSLAIAVASYMASVNDGYWVSAVPQSPTLDLQDGVVHTEVQLTGSGFAGVIGRHVVNNDSSESFLLCGIGDDGSASCWECVADHFTKVLAVDPGAFTLRDINLLTMTIVDTWFAFDINQQMVGEGSMTRDESGNWGVYAEGEGGQIVAAFQWLSVKDPVVVSKNFDDGSADPFTVGTNSYGITTSIEDGQFVATMPSLDERMRSTFNPPPEQPFGNGLIEARVSIDGNGSVGLFARWELDAAANSAVSSYACYLHFDGSGSCSRYESGNWTVLITSAPGTFVPTEMNTMTMRVTGTRLELYINGKSVGTIDDDALIYGKWGMFYVTHSDDPAENAVARFDSILILDMDP